MLPITSSYVRGHFLLRMCIIIENAVVLSCADPESFFREGPTLTFISFFY